MTPEVAAAVDELKATFAPATVTAHDDGSGGAHVRIDSVPLADVYVQDTTWLAFTVTFQYPLADVYPLFVRSDLARHDKNSLGEGMSAASYLGEPAVQLSRRSNHLNPATDTASLKALKVIQWLNSH